MKKKRRKSASMIRLCRSCGEPFHTYISQNKKYCSRTCSSVGRRKKQRRCEQCGEMFTPCRADIPGRFCSKKCRGVSDRKPRLIRGAKRNYYAVFAPDNPMATKQGYVMEHRIVMSEHIGRPLRRGEIVHHKDGNGFNNNIENLELLNDSDHKRYHANIAPRNALGRMTK